VIASGTMHYRYTRACINLDAIL